MGVFQSGFLLGIEEIDIGLNHPELSYVDLLGLFHDLPDPLPFKLLLIVLKNMHVFLRQQYVCPLYDMCLGTSDFNQL